MDLTDVSVPQLVGSGDNNDLQIAQARLTDEANGNREYTEAAERAQDPELKKLFLELAAEELEHTKRLTAWIEANQPAEKSYHTAAAPDDFTIIKVQATDNDQNLQNLLEYIAKIGNAGHSFSIVVDPDVKESAKTFSWDGDGSDHIWEVSAFNYSKEKSSLTEKGFSKSLTIEIAKVQDNVVYGVVLHANKPDLQGDVMSPDDIRKAMHEFMEEFRTINKDHADDINACPVECWQAKEPGKIGNSAYGEGDWLMGTKINDPAILADVLTGKYKSYSIEGTGHRELIEGVGA